MPTNTVGPLKGRTLLVRRSGALVAGVRTKSLSINGSPIDVTNDDDDGVRKLLDQPGQIDVQISVAGVLINDALIQEALSSSDRVAYTQFLLGSGSPDNGFSGQFMMTSFKLAGEHQGAAGFEAEFQSAGAVTFA